MKKTLCAAILGLVVMGSTANAQVRVGVNVADPWSGVSATFGSPQYYVAPRYYDGGYYTTSPSYYYSEPSYYYTPSYYGYSSSPSYYYGTPGVSIGFGQPYYGGWTTYGRSYYRGGRGRWR